MIRLALAIFLFLTLPFQMWYLEKIGVFNGFYLIFYFAVSWALLFMYLLFTGFMSLL